MVFELDPNCGVSLHLAGLPNAAEGIRNMDYEYLYCLRSKDAHLIALL